MELIVISDTKLKVMLSADDMKQYDLSDISAKSTKEGFRCLMREARERCGFNGLEGRVFVQLYRSREGGCELFITKLSGSDCGSDGGADYGRAENTVQSGGHRDTALRRTGNGRTVRGRYVIYRFDEMRYLLAICGVLLAAGYRGESKAYAENGREGFYLALEEETYAAGEHFGRLCPSSMLYYINEHCRMICGEAVSVLGKLS